MNEAATRDGVAATEVRATDSIPYESFWVNNSVVDLSIYIGLAHFCFMNIEFASLHQICVYFTLWRRARRPSRGSS